jgi:hypothetical protein
MSTTDRNSYDTGASAEAQANLHSVIGQLESVLNTRDAQVKAAMANFMATGVSDEYHAKEVQWNSAANEVRTIIGLVKTLLTENDATAQQTLSKAGAAVANIG